ncbi:hypothetical protein J4413_04580 [Candidatus Woesearchaeota archaeon]|nr:hypothetical protein [Candidatus Woesearchaeota archaeon]
MKTVISFNGPDNSGKTTQAELFNQHNPNLVEVVGKISCYEPFPKFNNGNSFKWWFQESTPEEFCDVIYQCLGMRNEDIKSRRVPFVIVDKGVYNFDARVIATLQQKGLSFEEAVSLATKYREKHSAGSIEHLRLFFTTGSSLDERIQLFRTRNGKGEFSAEQERIYGAYQEAQDSVLQIQFSNGVYLQIDGTRDVERVCDDVREIVFYYVGAKLPVDLDKVVFGLSGLSESGKSSIGYHLSRQHNIWNMKIKYFLRKIAERYGIEDIADLDNDDQALVAMLMVEQFSEFFKDHYYQRGISIESLHGQELTRRLKSIMGNQFRVIYVEAPLDLRIERTVSSEGVDLCTASERVLAKDERKEGRGVGSIRDEAHAIIGNSSSVFDLQRKVDIVAIPRWNFTGSLRMSSSFGISDHYKERLARFYEDLISVFGEQLSFLLFSGSCGREEVYDGWSDIDSVVGLRNNDERDRTKVNRLVCDGHLKVGTTVYSDWEIESGFLDAKTTYAFYNMQKGLIVPSVCSSELRLPVVTREDVVRKDYGLLPNKLHEVRRMIYGDLDQGKAFKKLVQIMRATLFIDGMEPKGYLDIEEKFAWNYRVPRFDFLSIIEGRSDLEEFRRYANKVVDCLGRSLL